MGIGTRLREERERLGHTQDAFAAVAAVGKRALIHYEKGERSPDAAFLAAIAGAGADVLYILTGERSGAHPAHDAAEQVLLDSYRRCNQAARQHLIQTAALLAAGVTSGVGATSGSDARSVSASGHNAQAAGRDINNGKARKS